MGPFTYEIDSFYLSKSFYPIIFAFHDHKAEEEFIQHIHNTSTKSLEYKTALEKTINDPFFSWTVNCEGQEIYDCSEVFLKNNYKKAKNGELDLTNCNDYINKINLEVENDFCKKRIATKALEDYVKVAVLLSENKIMGSFYNHIEEEDDVTTAISNALITSEITLFLKLAIHSGVLISTSSNPYFRHQWSELPEDDHKLKHEYFFNSIEKANDRRKECINLEEINIPDEDRFITLQVAERVRRDMIKELDEENPVLYFIYSTYIQQLDFSILQILESNFSIEPSNLFLAGVPDFNEIFNIYEFDEPEDPIERFVSDMRTINTASLFARNEISISGFYQQTHLLYFQESRELANCDYLKELTISEANLTYNPRDYIKWRLQCNMTLTEEHQEFVENLEFPFEDTRTFDELVKEDIERLCKWSGKD